MNKYKVAALTLIAFLIGDKLAIERANLKIKNNRRIHEREMQDNRQIAFSDGWDAALKSPTQVLQAADKLNLYIVPQRREK